MPELFPYQVTGAQWLANKPRALLADEPGLGKSAQAVTACDHVGAGTILIACPAAVRPQWGEQFSLFSQRQRPVQVITKKSDKPISDGVVVTSYDLLPDIARRIPDPEVFVADEAHYLKNHNAKRTKAAYSIARRSKRFWPLTGTPMPNHPGEMWALLRFLGATDLGYWDFVFRYCEGYQGDYGYRIMGTNRNRIPELRQMLSPVMLRRKKEDVMTELPAISVHNLPVEAGPVDEEIYFYDWWRFQDGRLKTRLDMELHTIETMMDVADRKREERHAASGIEMAALEATGPGLTTLRRYTAMQKIDAVANIVRAELEANQYQKIVIFAVHRDPIIEMRERLKEFNAVVLFGGTDPERRLENLRKFRVSKRCRVFIGNIQAAGTGIDGLQTVCSEVMFLEQDWVPANNAQAVMRLHRIGQKNKVRVRVASLAGSVDEKVQTVLRNKMRDIVNIFD